MKNKCDFIQSWNWLESEKERFILKSYKNKINEINEYFPNTKKVISNISKNKTAN